MRGSIKRALVLALMIFTALSVYGQTKSDLERKRAKLQKEIRETNKKLRSTQKSKTATTAHLEALRKKIELREELLNTINKEISTLASEIRETTSQINELEEEMEKLRADYASMIKFAQKNRSSYQRLMYIFAATDFNQAMKRMKYLQQYSESRKEQVARIDSAQASLENKKIALESQKEEKTALRNAQEKQKQALVAERREKDKLLAKLKNRERDLRKQLARKQRDKKKLDKAIADLIKKEIEEAKRRAAAAGKKNVTSENVFKLTPEAKKLSAGFANNKGKLPWPVASGKIISSFGDHPHPELKGIIIHNNGVDIRTSRSSEARSIFSGEVSGVINIPGANSAVIIRHGEYLSVYSNLEAIYVKKGDKVSTKQSIGRVYNDPDSKAGEVHLEIWKGTSKLDPAKWLARK